MFIVSKTVAEQPVVRLVKELILTLVLPTGVKLGVVKLVVTAAEP